MNIRILDVSDARIYQDLRLSTLKNNPEAFGSTYERERNYPLETVAERMKPTDDKFVLGALNETGMLVGIVAFVREGGIKTSHKANVSGMYVTPEYRGKGIGKALMLELIGRAKHRDGVEQINLAVISENGTAKKLYKSLGFEVFGVEHNALKYNGKYYPNPMNHMPKRNLNHFIEAQVHGDISLAYDVEILVADPSFDGTYIGRILEQLCLKYNIQLIWNMGFYMNSE